MRTKDCVTLACWFPVRPLLNLHVVPGAADEVPLLEGGVSWDVKGIPVLHQGDLRAVFGLLVDLEHHPALIQVDVLKKPATGQKKTKDCCKYVALLIFCLQNEAKTYDLTSYDPLIEHEFSLFPEYDVFYIKNCLLMQLKRVFLPNLWVQVY